MPQIKAAAAAERAAANAEARRRAEARITGALASNQEIMIKKRADFDLKQAHNEQRRKCGSHDALVREMYAEQMCLAGAAAQVQLSGHQAACFGHAYQ